MERLRQEGYGKPFRTLERGVERYVSALLDEAVRDRLAV
jgi:hypothetical protein